MPYPITQCYLPPAAPGEGDILAFTPAN